MRDAQAEPKASPSTSTTQPQKPQLPVEVFHERERRDEDQILAEMRGELIEDLVYSIDIQGRRVTNLSYAGVKEAIRHRGNLEILEVRTEETPDEIRALVRVRDHDNRIDVVGASSAEKRSPFAYTLAVNKAERNAFAKLIPAKWFAVLIEEYLEQKKGKATPGRPEEAEPPKPAEEWQPRVPVVKEPVVRDDVKQHPLIDGTRAIGMVNVLADRSEVSIVPERAVPVDAAPIRGFLISRVLDAIKAKHEGSDYRVDVDGEGMLRAILIRGHLEEHHVKELASASKWAFQRAMEAQAQRSGAPKSKNLRGRDLRENSCAWAHANRECRGHGMHSLQDLASEIRPLSRKPGRS